MMWNQLTRRGKSLHLLDLLRAASKSKKKLNEAELQRIRQVGQQQRLMLSEIEEQLEAPLKGVSAPSSEEERMYALYHLVFLMKSEPTLEPEEEESIRHFGERLDFHEGVLDDFIKLANKYKNSNVPVTDMVARIKRFVDTPREEPEEEA